MKKYIYLVIGLILILTLPNSLGSLVPPVDDYSIGFDLGVLSFHLFGFVFIFLYFRNAKKDRLKKEKSHKKAQK